MATVSPFAAHLEELRKRLLRVVICIIAATAALLTLRLEAVPVWGIRLYYPVPDPLHNSAAQITVAMRDALVPPSVDLIQTAPGEAFFAQVYIAALVGLLVCMPVAVRELAGFVGPALREAEVRVGLSVVAPAVGLFAGGAVFAYAAVVPSILSFLYQYGLSADIVQFLNVIDFVAFVLQFVLAFGASFQLPIIMYAVTASGAVDGRFWRRNMRIAVVVMVVFGAAITPDGTGVTMWLIAGPMIGLYAAGMAVAERRERQSASNT